MLIFDGDCGFCTTSADWIERRLPADAPVVPWQVLDDLDTLGLTADQLNEQAWWVTADGELRGGHLAIGEALVAAGGPWGLVGRLTLIPPFVWLGSPVYRLIARHRHRLPGGTPACRIDASR